MSFHMSREIIFVNNAKAYAIAVKILTGKYYKRSILVCKYILVNCAEYEHFT